MEEIAQAYDLLLDIVAGLEYDKKLLTELMAKGVALEEISSEFEKVIQKLRAIQGPITLAGPSVLDELPTDETSKTVTVQVLEYFKEKGTAPQNEAVDQAIRIIQNPI